MRPFNAIITATLLCGTTIPAAAQSGTWHYGFNMGIGEYSGGDINNGGTGVRISCQSDGSASIDVAHSGTAPPAKSVVHFSTSTGAVDFRTNDKGGIDIAHAATAPDFAKLWQMIRSGDQLGFSYATGAHDSVSLAGSAKVLSAKVCD